MKNINIAELRGCIIDKFEDFLSEKGIIIPNPERDQDEDLDPEEAANIYGDDYDELADYITDALVHHGLIEICDNGDAHKAPLTEEELREAYNEYTKTCRFEDISNLAEERNITFTEEEKEEIYRLFCKNMDNSEDWVYALNGAADEVLKLRS